MPVDRIRHRRIVEEVAADAQVTARERQILEQIVEKFQVAPQERTSDRIVEQTVEKSAPRCGQEIVEVVKVLKGSLM